MYRSVAQEVVPWNAENVVGGELLTDVFAVFVGGTGVPELGEAIEALVSERVAIEPLVSDGEVIERLVSDGVSSAPVVDVQPASTSSETNNHPWVRILMNFPTLVAQQTVACCIPQGRAGTLR
jgi:hypothetical protein